MYVGDEKTRCGGGKRNRIFVKRRLNLHLWKMFSSRETLLVCLAAGTHRGCPQTGGLDHVTSARLAPTQMDALTTAPGKASGQSDAG